MALSTPSAEPSQIKGTLSLSRIIMDDGHDLRKNGGSLVCRCPFHEERTPSFHVFDDDRGQRFKCFGCGAAGDIFDFWRWTRNVEFAQAKRDLAQLAGIRSDERPTRPVTKAPRASEPRKEEPPAPVAVLTPEMITVLQEGADYLEANPADSDLIASWRGWPLDVTKAVVRAQWITAPRFFHSQRRREMRVVSFPVLAPFPGEDGHERQEHVGAHYREFLSEEPLIDANGKTMRAAWYFAPRKCEERGEPGIPALPFVLGHFSEAKLVVVTEGEWDLITLAIAERWIRADGEYWPPGLCAVGIRGASGVGVFLRHWRRFWPIDAEALLICDRDEAGASWHTSRRGEETFLSRIRGLCRRAGIAMVAAPHKDLNDAYRAGAWPAGTLSQLLKASGFNYRLEVQP
jgi:hypothetical protein